ncbi:MAG: PfkB family carbohydrate kinase [Actinomycetota bacterium]|nr:PfkB family carbohydrate kinase [Actinomycetota bacterium]
MSRVVVVGDLVTDVLVRTHDVIAPGSDTKATVVARGGGAAANTACWLAECGVDAALVARVGGDEIGRARTLELLGHGVEAVVKIDHNAVTGTIVVLIGAGGERTMLTDRGANLRLAPEDLEARLFVPDAHLHLSGYVLLDDESRPAGLAALARARAAGMTVSVDAASAAPLARVGAEAFLSWTYGATLLMANRAEAEVLTGTDDAAAAAEQLSGWYAGTVIKAGADGAVWFGGGRLYQCPAQPTCVHDTTGAGDAFAAGLLADWLSPGATPDTALVAGAAMAARAVAISGGRPTGQ